MKESAHVKINYLKTSQFYPITAVCLVCFLLTFISVKLSTMLGIGLSFWLVMRGRPDCILGLFLLYFFRYYFHDPTSIGGSVPYELQETLTVAGFPLTVELVVCGFVSLRVFWEKLFRPKTYGSKFPKILFFLWVASFLPVLVGSCLGYQSRNIGWTRSLSSLMIVGSYFYGYILAAQWPRGRSDLLIPILLPLVVTMLLLRSLGIYGSHHCFFFLGLGAAFSIYFIRKHSLPHLFIGVVLLYLSAGYVIIFGSSFTTLGILLLSLFLAYLAVKPRMTSIRTLSVYVCGKRARIRNRIVKFVGGIAIFGILFFSVGVSTLGYHPDYDLFSSPKPFSATKTIWPRFKVKLLSDRLPLWHASLKQILSGPYFIVPSGRPILVPYRNTTIIWTWGAHNCVFEILRLNGLFAGIVIVIIALFALKNNLVILIRSADPVLKSLSAGVLSVGIVGMTMANFPFCPTVGVWLWSLAGLCHGLFLQDSPLPERKQLHPSRQSRPLASQPKQQEV